MGVQRRGRRQHDEQRDDVRKAHADERVELDARELARRLLRRFDQRLRVRVFLLVLDLFGRLPEEQIGADRRAEHGDHDGQIIAENSMWGSTRFRATVSQGTPTTNTVAT